MKCRNLFLFLILLIVPIIAEAKLCRVIYRPDGTVAIIHPATKARRKSEAEVDFLKRVFNKAVKGTDLEGLPYEDMDDSALPSREGVHGESLRNKWRGKKGAGVKVDPSVITIQEKRQKVVEDLDAELEKPNPDVLKALKLQRMLEN